MKGMCTANRSPAPSAYTDDTSRASSVVLGTTTNVLVSNGEGGPGTSIKEPVNAAEGGHSTNAKISVSNIEVDTGTAPTPGDWPFLQPAIRSSVPVTGPTQHGAGFDPGEDSQAVAAESLPHLPQPPHTAVNLTRVAGVKWFECKQCNENTILGRFSELEGIYEQVLGGLPSTVGCAHCNHNWVDPQEKTQGKKTDHHEKTQGKKQDQQEKSIPTQFTSDVNLNSGSAPQRPIAKKPTRNPSYYVLNCEHCGSALEICHDPCRGRSPTTEHYRESPEPSSPTAYQPNVLGGGTVFRKREQVCGNVCPKCAAPLGKRQKH